MNAFIIINEKDNVATALRDFKIGEKITFEKIADKKGSDKKLATQNLKDLTLKENIKSGHKFALRDINAGSEVIKYGEAIARASENISAGQWVHVHNTTGIRGRGDET